MRVAPNGSVKTIYEIYPGHEIGEAFEIAKQNGYDFIEFNNSIYDVSSERPIKIYEKRGSE